VPTARFDFFGVFVAEGGSRRSPATLHTILMDPYKTDTNEFQQSQSIGSMGDSKNCLKIAELAVCPLPDLIFFVVFVTKEGPRLCPATLYTILMDPEEADTN
jgi:hypothetical protein